ncbi:MAG: serine/threonine-protein kinase [Candidatus Margulisiibacteriota bacterium]
MLERKWNLRRQAVTYVLPTVLTELVCMGAFYAMSVKGLADLAVLAATGLAAGVVGSRGLSKSFRIAKRDITILEQASTIDNKSEALTKRDEAIRKLREQIDNLGEKDYQTILILEKDGETFPQTYLLGEEFARGGQASVRMAVNLSQGRRFEVIKIANEDVAKNPTFRKRFMREAEMLANFNHPNVVTVYGQGEIDGKPFYSMEYVHGASLENFRLSFKTFSIDDTITFIEKLVETFKAVHAAGIVHRDIKPDNLVITDKGETIVLDFGIALDTAKVADKLTKVEDEAFGTPEYMAFEQHMRDDDLFPIDCRTDLFAIGVVLFEMLTGTVPWPWTDDVKNYTQYYNRVVMQQMATDRIPEIARAIENVDTVKLGKALSILQGIFKKLLSSKKENRYSFDLKGIPGSGLSPAEAGLTEHDLLLQDLYKVRKALAAANTPASVPQAAPMVPQAAPAAPQAAPQSQPVARAGNPLAATVPQPAAPVGHSPIPAAEPLDPGKRLPPLYTPPASQPGAGTMVGIGRQQDGRGEPQPVLPKPTPPPKPKK